MEKVNAIVLRAAGVNCDLETQHALELAGAAAERIHINRIIETPALLESCQILVLPGGFSYGDDVAAGKILANQIVHHLREAMIKFIEDGKLLLGICNGFQVLIKTGIVPGLNGQGRMNLTESPVTLTNNDWIWLPVSTDPTGEAYAYTTLPAASLDPGVYKFHFFVVDCKRQRTNAPTVYYFEVE